MVVVGRFSLASLPVLLEAPLFTSKDLHKSICPEDGGGGGGGARRAWYIIPKQVQAKLQNEFATNTSPRKRTAR